MVKFTAICMFVLATVAISAPMPGEAEQLAKAERQAQKVIHNAAKQAAKELRQVGKADKQEERDQSRADRQASQEANTLNKESYIPVKNVNFVKKKCVFGW